MRCARECAPAATSGRSGEGGGLVPVQEQPIGDLGAGDAGGASKRARRGEELLLRPRAQSPIDALEGGGLLGRRARVDRDRAPVDFDRRDVEPAQRLFEFEPPQARAAVEEAGGEEDRRRRGVLFEDRQREVARVAIAVVEGHRREARPAFDEPPPRLGERDEFETEPANQRQRGVEEFGLDFEQPVGRVARRRRRERTNAMKREDDAAAARQRRDGAVQAADAKGGEARLDELVLERHARGCS